MVEKSPRMIDITKLRALLLLEADYNTVNKIIFNNRVLPSLEWEERIPYEIIGRCWSQASIYVTFKKILYLIYLIKQKLYPLLYLWTPQIAMIE